MLWGGMLGTCAVWGICFRLTFWELSWDVMEPVTYFIGSGLGKGHVTGWPSCMYRCSCMYLTPIVLSVQPDPQAETAGAALHAAQVPVLQLEESFMPWHLM